MPLPKPDKIALPLNPSPRNLHMSIVTEKELRNPLPRLGFFDCHAIAIRNFEETAKPTKRHDRRSSNETGITRFGDISSKMFYDRNPNKSSSNDAINTDKTSRTLPNPTSNGNISVLNSCKISDQNAILFNRNPKAQPTYTEAGASNTGSVKNKLNGGKALTYPIGKKMSELNNAIGSYKRNDSYDSDFRIENKDTLSETENDNRKSEGFRYLMEYLICLKNSSTEENDETDHLSPQMKPTDPKYFVDSLRKSASIFTFQHRVYDPMNDGLCAAAQQLHSRSIASARRITRSDSTDERDTSELTVFRDKIDQWMDRVSTSEFLKTLYDVLNMLGDKNCQPWSGLHHCRYLRMPPSQDMNHM